MQKKPPETLVFADGRSQSLSHTIQVNVLIREHYETITAHVVTALDPAPLILGMSLLQRRHTVVPRFLPEADTPAHWVFLPARSFTFQRRQQLVLVHPHSSDWGRYTLLHTYLRAASSHFYNSNCSTRVATHTTHHDRRRHGNRSSRGARWAPAQHGPRHRRRRGNRSSRGAHWAPVRRRWRADLTVTCRYEEAQQEYTPAQCVRAACDAEPADCDDCHGQVTP